ncbi:BRO family protein [Brevibacterium sp. 91QC2O2]|uniref:phage antirepressor n=1 Tax=Brevibacterium sp. 91QC2O2 TaxID=2968458 RepID=UPI00211C3229|nr:phage antirepressor KilAC domain-containing protein [Brevibacterium sp. 91QC2O2]MCQ9367978.1 BRO family protein [Brevibacterium sp. 91QC2O2]
MNELMNIFSYQDTEIRVVMVDGEPWFVAADIARILGYRMASDMTRRLDEDERGTRSVRTPSGEQEMTVISEPGLYSAVMGSQVPGAKAFKRWITREVLPSIRKTGGYGATPAALDDQQIVARALQITTAQVAELEAARAVDAPKVQAYEALMDSDGAYSIGAVAKIIGQGWSQNRLFQFLRSDGVLIPKGHLRNTPYQRYAHHFDVAAGSYERSDGTRGTSHTTRVLPSGLDFIRRRIAAAQARKEAPADAVED